MWAWKGAILFPGLVYPGQACHTPQRLLKWSKSKQHRVSGPTSVVTASPPSPAPVDISSFPGEEAGVQKHSEIGEPFLAVPD